MRIAVVHNTVSADSPADERDVLDQVQAVVEALRILGHNPAIMACTLDLAAVKAHLETIRPDMVFNLVEALDGHGRLIHLFPALLDAMRMPYSGAPTEAVFLTSNKILAKERLAAAHLPTPAWIGPYCLGQCRKQTMPNAVVCRSSGQWLVKSLWEHASIGLEEDALVTDPDPSRFPEILAERAPQLGGACFAEAYIDGREFNLALLAGDNGLQVLAPAEILFEGYAEDRLRIVGYRAKWQADSYEYHHTPRRFEFPATDRRLLSELEAMAMACWRLFGLKGYARVDFRVDHRGRPWILEINNNPCLAPDAGFAAALAHEGLAFTEAVRRILADGHGFSGRCKES
jgi:D-alanine-D-alanine ligase